MVDKLDRVTKQRVSAIYALVHADEIRYIGKTAVSVQGRLHKHLHAARNGDRTYRSCWIRSVNYDVQVRVLEEVPEGADLNERERHWIARLRDGSIRLTNLTEGGDGLQATPELRARLSDAQKRRFTNEDECARCNKSRTDADERARRSQGQKLRYVKEDERRKTSEAVRSTFAKTEIREAISKRQRARYQDPAEREKLRQQAFAQHARRRARTTA